MTKYAYLYSTLQCPNCKADLSQIGALQVELVENDGTPLPSCADYLLPIYPMRVVGQLVDCSGLVEAGKHSQTLCAHCGHPLIDYEHQVEWEVSKDVAIDHAFFQLMRRLEIEKAYVQVVNELAEEQEMQNFEVPEHGCRKTTEGYVEQVFDQFGKCIAQRFVAGDPCEYEDENGTTLEDDDCRLSFYEPFDMADPTRE